jgi:NADH-quinone oxidoreductase subunit E
MYAYRLTQTEREGISLMTDVAVNQETDHNEPAEAEVHALMDKLGVCPTSDLISVLQQVQDRLGYLPATCLEQISRRTKIPLSRIYGVVSFYAQFYTEPHGRHTIRVCRGTACHVKGAGRVLEAVEHELGIDEGESTSDLMFYLETVACLGTCFLAPVIMIDNQYFGQLTAQRVKTILQSYQTNG